MMIANDDADDDDDNGEAEEQVKEHTAQNRQAKN